MTGIVLMFVDQAGACIATATDFANSGPAGFTLQEAQQLRARRRLEKAVIAAYSSPRLAQAIDEYEAQSIVSRLCRSHGCKIHEVVVTQSFEGMA